MNAAVEITACPRCGAFELVDGEFCLVCGFDGATPPPHYSLHYQFPGQDIDQVADPETIKPFPCENLANAEAWLARRESEGYAFTSCVTVTALGHVVWLRGNPGDWNWDSK